LLKKLFGNRVEGKQGVPVDTQELALRGVRASLKSIDSRTRERGIKAEKSVQPLFNPICSNLRVSKYLI
jgi:hypothetical protein